MAVFSMFLCCMLAGKVEQKLVLRAATLI